MKAIVVDAEWVPRKDAEIAPELAAKHWAVYANEVWRNPTVSLTTVADPEGPGPHEVILKVAACGICGSDVHMFETDAEGYMLLPYHLRSLADRETRYARVAVRRSKSVRRGRLVDAEDLVAPLGQVIHGRAAHGSQPEHDGCESFHRDRAAIRESKRRACIAHLACELEV